MVTYSFSQYNDKSFGVWAAGRAGWYELKVPSRSYRNIYKEMEEAIGMFYYLADKFRDDLVLYSKASSKALDSHVRYLFKEVSACNPAHLRSLF